MTLESRHHLTHKVNVGSERAQAAFVGEASVQLKVRADIGHTVDQTQAHAQLLKYAVTTILDSQNNELVGDKLTVCVKEVIFGLCKSSVMHASGVSEQNIENCLKLILMKQDFGFNKIKDIIETLRRGHRISNIEADGAYQILSHLRAKRTAEAFKVIDGVRKATR
jgi:hypothetical protein